MSDPDRALATQLANIQQRSGRSWAELEQLVRGCGKTRHGEIRDSLRAELGLGYGDANTVVHVVLRGGPQAPAAPADDVAAALYEGRKAALRPIHDAVMARANELGAFEIAPKKAYLSLRRTRQFAMVGPATNTRVEVGLNLRGVEGTERLVAQPPKGMCSHIVRVTDVAQVDDELAGWLRQAYELAG